MGDITVTAYNPNVSLSQYPSVRNGNIMVGVQGNSVLTGGNITLQAFQNGNLSMGIPVFLMGATLTAENDITLKGHNAADSLASVLELRGGNNRLTATGGNITIENHLSDASGQNAVFLNGTGSASTGVVLTAGKGIILNGRTGSGAGVKAVNTTLNASHATITGTAAKNGNGFSLTSMALQGGLADLANVSLSSAGSAAGAYNVLDNTVVNAGNRDTLLAKKIENMTSLEMNGDVIFDDTSKADKGWTQDYTSADTPYGGWIFNNTTVTSGGDVNLKGAAFTNSTLTITNGSLNITNAGPAMMTGTTITANDGGVTIHTGSGNIDLTKGNISAKNDITLTADNGGISIVGTNMTDRANITAGGAINITANNKFGMGVLLNYVNITSGSRSVNIKGVSDVSHGVYIRNATFSGGANISGVTNAFQGNNYYDYGIGGVVFDGGAVNLVDGNYYINGTSNNQAHGVVFSKTNLSIDKDSTADIHGETKGLDTWGYVAGVLLSDYVNVKNDGVMNVTGVASLGKGAAVGVLMGIYNQFSPGGGGIGGIAPDRPNQTYYGNGVFNINGSSVTGNGIATMGWINVANASVNINGSSEKGSGVIVSTGMGTADDASLNITGNSTSGNGVFINNGSLSSNSTIGENGTGIQINGSSGSGNGVLVGSGFENPISNITINASSDSGNGLVMQNNGGINGSVVNASSSSGNGVVINGQVSSTDTVMNGHTETGSGVNITGNLTNAGSSTVTGNASGSGAGVNLGGNVSGGSIAGDSATGTGVVVSGSNSTVNNTTVSGSTSTGTGVDITGNLTNA
ncbi:hypothetical protein EQ70_23605, partial [Salmonella enterica subsp. houtenae]|nr:hypothetical protein [Salmonella enterica subsp. houtenae]